MTPACLVALAVAAGSLAAGAQPAAASPRVLEKFEVAGDGDVLVVPVTLNGKTYRFVVDTGATLTVFDTTLRPALGEPRSKVDTRIDGRPATIELFPVPRASVGRLRLPADGPVTCVDLNPLRRATDWDIRGILGMDFLGARVLRFDPDAGTLTFLSAAGPAPGVPMALGRAADDGLPRVRARVLGFGEEEFIVDTGHVIVGRSGTLRSAAMQALLKKRQAEPLREELSGDMLARYRTVRPARVGEVSLAGFRHSGLIFTEQGASDLSMAFWCRFVVTFDFPAGRMYLKKAKGLDRPDGCDGSGLFLQRSNGQTFVNYVAPRSAGAAAGLRAKDVVVRVAGKQADRSRLYELRTMLCGTGQRISMVVRRDGKEREVTLVLKERY